MKISDREMPLFLMAAPTAASVPYTGKEPSEFLSDQDEGKPTSCGINVSVSSLQGLGDGLFLIILILPGPKANGRNRGTSIQLEKSSHVARMYPLDGV